MSAPEVPRCQFCLSDADLLKISLRMAKRMNMHYIRDRFICRNCYKRCWNVIAAAEAPPTPKPGHCIACNKTKGANEKWKEAIMLPREVLEILNCPQGVKTGDKVCRSCTLIGERKYRDMRARFSHSPLLNQSYFATLYNAVTVLNDNYASIVSMAKSLQVEEFANAVDRMCGGFFTMTESALSPLYAQSDRALDTHSKRTVNLIMSMIHMRNSRQNGYADMISDYLHLNHLSYDGHVGMGRFSSCTSPETHRRRVQLSEPPAKRRKMDCDSTFVGILDDFGWLSRPAIPTASGTFSRAESIGTIVMKEVPEFAPPIQFDNGTGHGVKNPDGTEGWRVCRCFDDQWSRCAGQSNFEVTKSLFNGQSKALAPYDTRRVPIAGSDGAIRPVSMDNVSWIDAIDVGMKTKDAIAEAIQSFVNSSPVQGYLNSGHVLFVTGDWHIFRGFVDCVESGSIPNSVVPLPGGFHISLNLQEAVFENYGPVLEIMWKLIHADTGFSFQSCLRRPLRRKFFLDLVNESWIRVREGVIQSLDSVQCGSVEINILMSMFEQVVPLSCCIYAAQLMGDLDCYVHMLCRALPVFLQLNKSHYVSCCSKLLSDLGYWKEKRPDVYSFAESKIQFLSEEEIEIAHSYIRPLVKDAPKASAAVTKVRYLDYVWEEQTEFAKSLGSGKRRSGHCLNERSWLSGDGLGRKMDDAVADLFKRILVCGGAVYIPSKKSWRTVNLGIMKDKALPLPLQMRNAKLIPDEMVRHRGTLSNFQERRFCGHKSQTLECSTCKTMYSRLLMSACSEK